jgi:hypothetical protein
MPRFLLATRCSKREFSVPAGGLQSSFPPPFSVKLAGTAANEGMTKLGDGGPGWGSAELVEVPRQHRDRPPRALAPRRPSTRRRPAPAKDRKDLRQLPYVGRTAGKCGLLDSATRSGMIPCARTTPAKATMNRRKPQPRLRLNAVRQVFAGTQCGSNDARSGADGNTVGRTLESDIQDPMTPAAERMGTHTTSKHPITLDPMTPAAERMGTRMADLQFEI